MIPVSGFTENERFRGRAHALLWFAIGNTALAFANAAGYLATAEPLASVGGSFVRIALAGYVSAACLLLALVLLPSTRVLRIPTWTVATLAALAFTTLQFFLLVDRKQYALYKFHLNGLAINILFTPGGWESMHVSNTDMAWVTAGALLALALQAAAFGLLVRRFTGPRTPAALPLRRRWLTLAGVVLALAAVDRVTYAWADLENIRAVTHSARIVPLYQPFTVKRIARKWFGMQVDNEMRLAKGGGAAGDSLLYPKTKLVFETPARTPNILWLTLDSLRFDALRPEMMPHVSALAEKSTVFTHHLSGGNSTRFGVFSMFYGIHGSYWHPVLAERRGPVLVSRLKELGYRTKILSSTSLTWPEFRRTAFVEIPESVEDAMPGPDTKDKDRQLTERFSAFLDGTNGGAAASGTAGAASAPFFAWLFFDSSHAPYDFEPAGVKFTPFAEQVSYTGLESLRTDDAKRALMFHRYQNAVVYLDGLVGKVLDDLARRGLLDKTIVVVSGDHGEEYFEHGYFGHNGAFTPEQIHVPLVVWDPTRAPARVDRLTGHQDLAATFTELLGAKSPPSDYSLGRSLFGTEPDPYEVSCSWDQCALVDSAGWLVFGTETYNASGVDVLGPDYKDVADPKAVLKKDAPELIGIMREMSAFLK